MNNRKRQAVFLVMSATLAMGHGRASALQQMYPQAHALPEQKNPTYPRPTAFSLSKDGTSFALVAHTEPYHANQQALVALWFRTTRPEINYFRLRTGLTLTVVDSRGSPLRISQPEYMRNGRWAEDGSVGIMNGVAYDIDLNGLYKLNPGTYSVTATIRLANEQAVSLTAPPISIKVEK